MRLKAIEQTLRFDAQPGLSRARASAGTAAPMAAWLARALVHGECGAKPGFKAGDAITDHRSGPVELAPGGSKAAGFLYQIYTAAEPGYSGRVTVPALWDKELGTIVNNESAEILRLLGNAFDGIGARSGDYYPQALRAEIDAVNARVYDGFNNGVYRAGFATSQTTYAEAVARVFKTLDWLEYRLSGQRYLTGGQLTEADTRLFTTLVRFDEVCPGHFKCNRRQIADYSHLSYLGRFSSFRVLRQP